MNRIVIDARNLTRRFGDLVAVRDVSFQVQRGSIFGLLGPNGSGKSTIIRMLLGILPPSDGTMTLLDHDAYAQSELIKPRVGYMSQQFSLYADLSVAENIQFYGRVYGLDPEQLRASDGRSPRADIDARLRATSSPAHSRADGNVDLRWRARWSMNQKCCSWMNRRRALIRSPGDIFGTCFSSFPDAASRCLSRRITWTRQNGVPTSATSSCHSCWCSASRRN